MKCAPVFVLFETGKCSGQTNKQMKLLINDLKLFDCIVMLHAIVLPESFRGRLEGYIMYIILLF